MNANMIFVMIITAEIKDHRINIIILTKNRIFFHIQKKFLIGQSITFILIFMLVNCPFGYN